MKVIPYLHIGSWSIKWTLCTSHLQGLAHKENVWWKSNFVGSHKHCCWRLVKFLFFKELFILAELVSSLGRALDFGAGGRAFESRPNPHSWSINNWGGSAAFVMDGIRTFPLSSDSAYDSVSYDPESEAEAEEGTNHNAWNRALWLVYPCASAFVSDNAVS